ncbi:hypothetical protein, partial [Burkholderia sp. E168m23]|uniref:hypothetical protein n=1 Tax=Burkholderia sp. E168m23 TaxID=1561200 RepID=UPI001F2FAEB1
KVGNRQAPSSQKPPPDQAGVFAFEVPEICAGHLAWAPLVLNALLVVMSLNGRRCFPVGYQTTWGTGEELG